MPKESPTRFLEFNGTARDWYVNIRLNGVYLSSIARTSHRPTGLGAKRYEAWTATIAGGTEFRATAFSQIKKQIAAYVAENLVAVLAHQEAMQVIAAVNTDPDSEGDETASPIHPSP